MYFDWHFDPTDKRHLECALRDGPRVIAKRTRLPMNVVQTDVEVELIAEVMSNV